MVSPLDRVGGGEVGRGGKPSHIGITGAIYGNPHAFVVYAAAAQIGRVDQLRPGRIEFRDKGITLATNSALHGVGGGGKVARDSESGHVSVAGPIHSNPKSMLAAGAAQVGRIEQLRPGRIEFRDESHIVASGDATRFNGLHGVGGGGKVARASESGQVSVARAVHSNPVGPLTAVCETSAAQVSGIDQRRTGCIEFGYERIGEGVAVSTTLHRL